MSDHDPTYAAKLLELLNRVSPDSHRVFVDVGAHKGDFGRMLAKAFPDCRIFAIEADTDLCAGLQRLAAGEVDMDVSNYALHEGAGEIEFFVHLDRGTSSVFPRSSAARRYYHSSDRVVESRRVPAISLDRFLQTKGIGHVDLLKLDTQGAEAAILRGAGDSLSAQSIDVIYTEFFTVPHYQDAPLLHELWGQLAHYGYRLYDLFKGPCGINGQLRFGDAIFVSPRFGGRYIDGLGFDEP